MALTPPHFEARAHSERLAAVIREHIDAQDGGITFSEFMRLALYAPGLGYYTAGSEKLGAGGDFVTAPELGSLLGCCLASQCVDILAQSGGGIVEFGAGSGALAATVLEQMDAMTALPDTYLIVEVSPDLKARQQARIAQCGHHIASRVQWIDRLPDRITGVVVANEVLDALPVSRFQVETGEPTEARVINVDDGFGGCFAVADQAPWLASARHLIARYKLSSGYVSEMGWQARAWIKSVAERLTSGALLVIDYGYPEHEYYHAQRSTGTLRCHYRHQAHDDPYVLVGLQDITAHVDFTALAREASEAGLTPLGYTQQAAFLLSLGITDFAETLAGKAPEASVKLASEIKMLTLPQEMGEAFKVFAAGRDVAPQLKGFALQNHLHRLSIAT